MNYDDFKQWAIKHDWLCFERRDWHRDGDDCIAYRWVTPHGLIVWVDVMDDNSITMN